MSASLSQHTHYQPATFQPSYENVHALLAEIHLYVFGRDGRLVASQAVRRDRVTVAVTDEVLRDARIIVAPPLAVPPGQPITLALAREQPVFETELPPVDGQYVYALPPVPEAVWRWWLVHSLWPNVGKSVGKKSRLFGW